MVETFTLDFYRWRRLSNGQAFQTDQEANVCGRDIGQEDDEVDDGDIMYKYIYIYCINIIFSQISWWRCYKDADVIFTDLLKSRSYEIRSRSRINLGFHHLSISKIPKHPDVYPGGKFQKRDGSLHFSGLGVAWRFWYSWGRWEVSKLVKGLGKEF